MEKISSQESQTNSPSQGGQTVSSEENVGGHGSPKETEEEKQEDDPGGVINPVTTGSVSPSEENVVQESSDEGEEEIQEVQEGDLGGGGVTDTSVSVSPREDLQPDSEDSTNDPPLPITLMLKEIAYIAIPMLLTSLFSFIRSIISTCFLGPKEQAGGSYAIGFANITGYSVLKEVTMGMEPICTQAFENFICRRRNFVCQTYHKTFCLVLLTAILISLLWLFMEPILLSLPQDRNTISVAHIYIRYSLLDLLAQALLHSLRSFLTTQNINSPVAVSAFCALILHCPISYFLVKVLNHRVKGVSLASGVTSSVSFLGLLLYISQLNLDIKPCEGLKMDITFFQGWLPLLAGAIPSLSCVCLQWWAYELMIVISRWLDDPQVAVAAMGVLIQTTGFISVLAHSLRIALSTRISRELGANKPQRARRASIVGLGVAVCSGSLAFGFTMLVKNWWGVLYTREPKTLVVISKILPILGICEMCNCFHTAASGVLIASAQPMLGTKIYVWSFYIISFLVAGLLGFKLEMGCYGLWYGILAAQISCVGMMIYALVRTDWAHQAQRVMELTQVTGTEEDSLETSLLP